MMMAQDPADLCKDDPLMSVVTTYGQLSRVRVKPMFAVAVPNDYARNITKSAVKSASNLIILPWQTQDSMSPSTQTSFEPLSDDFKDEVLSTASCSVALFMDRGFGLTPKKTTTTQKVVLLFFGQPDGTEALSFVSHFIGNEKCELVIVNAKIGHDKSTVDNFSDLRHLSGVRIEDIVCESLLDAATRFAQDLSKTDLVVLGHCHYKGSLKTWVDQNCKASVTLVQKYQKKITAAKLIIKSRLQYSSPYSHTNAC
jgi:hypothetical protein